MRWLLPLILIGSAVAGFLLLTQPIYDEATALKVEADKYNEALANSKILQQEEISPKDFFIKEMQEASSEGGFRQAAIQCTNYSANDNVVEFSLSRGSFATILLREIMKPNDPILAGF